VRRIIEGISWEVSRLASASRIRSGRADTGCRKGFRERKGIKVGGVRKDP